MSKAIIKKTNAAEVQQVIDWIIAGQSMYDINEAIDRQITSDKKKKDLLFNNVLEYFKNSGQADPAVIKGWAMEALRDLYRRMIEANDYPSAAKVIKDIYKLHG